MFDDMPISGAGRRPTHVRWTILVSMAGQLSVLALLLVIPMMYVQALPAEWRIMGVLAPPSPAAPAPAVRSVEREPPRDAITIPSFIPPHAKIVRDATPAPAGPNSGTLTDPRAIPGMGGGEEWNSIFSPNRNGPPAPEALVIGGEVQAARLIHLVPPKYPKKARNAHVQGRVVLEATIARDGTVSGLRYISGPLILVPTVEKAVREWRYRPTFLNGMPVEVQTTITVIFTLKPTKAKGEAPKEREPDARPSGRNS